ncbi:ABC transporter ATP-binding protein, partial [Methylobacterium radiotolerans]
MNETSVQEAAPRVASSSASPAVDDRPVALELIDVRKHFGSGERRVSAVDGVDLSIRRGEVVALLGPTARARPSTLGHAPRAHRPHSGT